MITLPIYLPLLKVVTVLRLLEMALPMPCFPLWYGVSEAWLIPSKHIKRKTIALHRGARLFFDHYAKKKHLKRLQFTVHSTNFQAVRWAKRCYFNEEGRLKNYGPDGKDHFMFARYY